MALLRIPFEEAIASSLLMKGAWDNLSIPQQTVALTIYGLPMPTERHHKAWVALQELAALDELGYPVGYPDPLPPYTPGRYGEVLFLCGRRGGKTRTVAFCCAYEAGFGAHEEYLSPGEQGVIFWVGQDQRTAQINFNLVKGIFSTSPMLKQLLLKEPTVERIDLKPPEPGMGRLSLMCIPPKVASMRGPACPIAVFDELVAWPSDPDAADPDEVVYTTIRKAQMTFRDRKLFMISSVGFRQGLIWKAYSAGTNGKKLEAPEAQKAWQRLLVLVGTTGGMENPHADRAYLLEESAKDDFPRECLSQWQDVESGAIPGHLLDHAIDAGVTDRPPKQGCFYTAAIDPAFRGDSFTFTICHADTEGGVTQDLVREMTVADIEDYVQLGVIDPERVFAQVIAPLCRVYGIHSVYCDQHHTESLHAIGMRHGVGVIRTPFTMQLKVEMLATFVSLLRQARLRLVENANQRHQFLRLRKIRTENGNIQIRAPKGEHDDLAMGVMLAIHKTVPMAPDPAAMTTRPPRTFQDDAYDQVMRQRLEAGLQVPEEWMQDYFERQSVEGVPFW